MDCKERYGRAHVVAVVSAAVLSIATVLSSSLCATARDTQDDSSVEVLVVTAADNGSTIRMSRSQVLVVKLPAEPASGFGWRLSPLSVGQFELLGKSHGRVEQPSASGREFCILQLRPRAVGHALLRLEYARPGELNPLPGHVFLLHIDIYPEH